MRAMKFRWFLLLIIILIAIPHLSAVDTDDWEEVTVNNVDFKIPEKFSNGEMKKDNTCYTYENPLNFLIFSLFKYDNLKRMYGSSITSDSLIDVEETEIDGHHDVVLYLKMISTVWIWSIFDELIAENTDHIYIKNIETEWANYSNGYYGYNFDLEIHNLSSNHEIQSVISFYDLDGKLIKNDNLSGGINEPISQGKVEDNLTITLEDYQKSYSSTHIDLRGGITNFDYCEVDHIKIDVIDVNEDKLLYTINQSFNMSNLWNSDDISSGESDDDSGNAKTSKSDSDYRFFEDTDSDGDGVISFKEFSEISYVFTEDSFWEGYSIEEILQSEWDMADSDGDDYLTFEEFKKVI